MQVLFTLVTVLLAGMYMLYREEESAQYSGNAGIIARWNAQSVAGRVKNIEDKIHKLEEFSGGNLEALRRESTAKMHSAPGRTYSIPKLSSK